MWSKGAPHASWVLSCDYFELHLDTGKMTGVIARVKFSSAFLWSGWFVNAVSEVEIFLYDFFLKRMVHLQVSELHVATDVAGLAVDTMQWQKVIVCKALKGQPLPGDAVPQKNVEWVKDGVVQGADSADYYGRRLETLTFGTHGSQISAQFYNKSRELMKSGKLYMPEIWKRNGYDGESIVWRLEIRLRRRELGHLGIDDPYDLNEQIASLWSLLVGNVEDSTGWLRIVQPSSKDTNRARWHTAKVWRLVQTWQTHEVEEGDLVEVQRNEKRSHDVKQFYSAIVGSTTSLGALMTERGELTEDDDFSVVLSRLMAEAEVLFDRKKTNFKTELRRKKQRYFIPLEGVDIAGSGPGSKQLFTSLAMKQRIEEQKVFEQLHGVGRAGSQDAECLCAEDWQQIDAMLRQMKNKRGGKS